MCYLINRSPSIPLEFDIPERVWTGKDVSYLPLEFDIPERVWTGKDVSCSHLKVFGWKAFVYVPKE